MHIVLYQSQFCLSIHFPAHFFAWHLFLFFVNAAKLHQEQKIAHGEQLKATQLMEEAWEKAKIPYMDNVTLFRKTFANETGILSMLGLVGNRADGIAKWLEQANRFYSKALADDSIIEKVAYFNLTREKLQADWDLVKELEKAEAHQESCKGAAQDATKLRNAALKELREWFSKFVAAARIAFADRPQLLEKMGIKVKS